MAQGELGNLPPAQTAQTARGFFMDLPAYIEIDCSAPVWGTSVLVPPGQAAMAPSHQAAPTLHTAPGNAARGAERTQARPRGVGPVCVNARGNEASGHVPFTFLWAGQRPIYERSAPAQVSVSCRLCGGHTRSVHCVFVRERAREREGGVCTVCLRERERARERERVACTGITQAGMLALMFARVHAHAHTDIRCLGGGSC